jgi:hypothetical protein
MPKKTSAGSAAREELVRWIKVLDLDNKELQKFLVIGAKNLPDATANKALACLVEKNHPT